MASAAWLEQEGYTLGYSSFWNANVLTELSDGQIEMVPLDGRAGRCARPVSVAGEAGQPVPGRGTGTGILLLYVHEKDRYENLTAGRTPVYEDDNYYIYSYETAGEFLTLLNQE